MRLIADDILGVITVWMEAEGEDIQGKVMVAEVILTRARKKGRSIGEVVLALKQFSEWNENDPRSIRALLLDDDTAIVQECVRAWTTARHGSTFAQLADHYHATYIDPPPAWAAGMKVVARHGGHIFYKS